MYEKASPATYFRRVEQKYLLSPIQYREFLAVLGEFVHADAYGLTKIYSLYYDTDDFALARRSMDKSGYKEKLRVRSYGIPRTGDRIYCELKKKLKGVTYKRRLSLIFKDVDSRPDLDKDEDRNPFYHELQWFIRRYNPKPKLMFSYDRQAFCGGDNEDLRITFDANICWKAVELDPSGAGGLSQSGASGCLDTPGYMMELKTNGSIPFLLCRRLAELKIFPVSFSKYREAYRLFVEDSFKNHKPFPGVKYA
jgi:hypothetical protein